MVTLELIPQENGTRVKLSHAGFLDEESKKGHEQAWPMVLVYKEKCIKKMAQSS